MMRLAFALFLALVLGGHAPLRGACVVRSAADVRQLRASWWYSWTTTPPFAAPGFVPMVRDPQQLAALKRSSAPGLLLAFNEPNLPEQADMTLDEVVTGLQQMYTLRPYAPVISPALYGQVGQTYGYGYRDMVLAYEARYGHRPIFYAIAVHAYADDAQTALTWVDYVRAEMDALGYERTPIWLTEYGTWPGGDAQRMIREMRAGTAARPWIERYCWFPAHAVTDPGGTAWDNALLDSAGRLTAVGREYVRRGK